MNIKNISFGGKLKAPLCLSLLLLLVIPVSAATVTKTWTFASGAETFVSSTGAQSTAAWDGTTGNPAGALYTRINGRNVSNANYWEWTGTFENMGVPAGATVTGIQLVGGYTRCTVYNRGAPSTAGPWELRDNTGATVLATLYGGRTFTGTDPSWVAASGTLQPLSSLPSATSVLLRLNNTLSTSFSRRAEVRLYDDQVSVRITYTPPATTTIGNGADPSNAALCPDGPATMLDAFTLQTDSGTDTVTAVTVSLAAGSSSGISLVEITNDAGGTVYGAASNPASDTVSIPLGTNINVTTTLTQYKVRITPKSAAAMPAPPGSTYIVTGTITAVTCTNTQAYSDAASATVTIDNLSPSDATWGVITPGDTQIVLNWTNPGDADFAEVVILRSTSAISDTPSEGATYIAGNTIGASTVRYVGSLQTFVDTGLTNGQAYYYKIFAKDNCGNYATGVQAGPYTPASAVVITGVPTATSVLCNQVTISAPFAGDNNNNSTTTVSVGPSATGPWTAVCSNLAGPSPRTCTDSTVAASTTYYYEVTFSDADGISGTNPQVVGPVTTPVCSPKDTTITGNTATVNSCKQITAVTEFTGDANGNSSTQVEYGTTATGPWTVSCATLTGPSPRQCIISGLSPSISYWVRFTYTDVDGVTGTNPEVVGPFTTTACGADQVPPTVLFVAPARNAVVGGIDRAKVQVFDAGDPAPTVEWSVDGSAFSPASLNGNYNCGTNCGIYGFNLDVTALGNGSHTLAARATDAAGNVTTVDMAIRVNNKGTAAGGEGTLLRRTHGSEMCTDCHNLETHSSQYTSTKYGSWALDCLTCHTPHKTRNIYLIRESLRTPNSGVKTIDFHVDDKAGGTNPQDSYLGAYTVDANATPTDDGICEACHTKTIHYRNDTSGGDHTHNQGTRCINCHKHKNGFAGSGNCLACHGKSGEPGTTGPHNLRPVLPDFSLQSHHVGNGSATMGGTLTNFDCVVCHAEGKVVAGPAIIVTGQHMNGVIDLRNADSTTAYYSYDKSGMPAGAANWNSGNAVWRTQTSTNLDPFCLSCHDSNGASVTFNAADGGSPSNPFGDAGITNEVDQQNRGGVVDIKSMISGNPPTKGTFARHAIRGQSTSIYTVYTGLGGGNSTIYDAGGFTSMGTDEKGNPNWNDTSVMGCADCHTVDGANGASGNAHGSTSEYLLKDASGTATEGNSIATYVCERCHKPVAWGFAVHGDGSAMYIDSTNLTGTARIAGNNGSIFGIACLNCHGGANSNGENPPTKAGFGRIHGTDQVFNNGAGGTRNAYRFMNGGGLRFYDPGGWTGTAVTCYTLGSADGYSSCTRHSGGRGGTKPFSRPLNY